jgi:hypothetical protein
LPRRNTDSLANIAHFRKVDGTVADTPLEQLRSALCVPGSNKFDMSYTGHYALVALVRTLRHVPQKSRLSAPARVGPFSFPANDKEVAN